MLSHIHAKGWFQFLNIFVLAIQLSFFTDLEKQYRNNFGAEIFIIFKTFNYSNRLEFQIRLFFIKNYENIRSWHLFKVISQRLLWPKGYQV